MLELTDWYARVTFPAQPWLVVGKGPTFDRRDRFDLTGFNVVGINHVVREVRVDIAHIIDIGVVADCADVLASQSDWLLMPRWPHEASRPGTRMLEGWFDEIPVLRELDERGRLVWYNGITARPEPGSPVIDTGEFSSEAVLRILGRMGASTVRTLGIDGGRSYAAAFGDLAESTLLENGAPAFDVQFDRLREIADEFGLDVRPLVEPLRVFIGTDESQVVAHRVLEYSIRKHASIPVEVVPMLDLPQPVPSDPRNRPRTSFSFTRFMIPKLCGYEGRALYLDADMLVFGDVAELADLTFGEAPVMCTPGEATSAWDGHETIEHFGAGLAVMLLDCDRLRWDVEDVVASLDAGRYTYEELMSDASVIDGSAIAATIPHEWNHLEDYDPATTRLLHFTVVPTQPWKNDANPLAEVWMHAYREAVQAGAVPPEEVEALIDAGQVKESLRASLRLAPTRRSVVTNASLDLIDARRRIASLEARIEAMERSSSWRIGHAVTRAIRRPVDVVHRTRGILAMSTRLRTGQASSNGNPSPQPAKPSIVIQPGKTPIKQYTADLWHHRDMLKILSRRQILLRYRQTALGAVWVVLQPLLGAGVLSFVFGKVAKLPTDGVPTFIFTYTGMLAWSAFSGTLARAQGSMVNNSSLVAKIFFPRVILPLSNVYGTLIDFAVTLGVLLVLLFSTGLPPSWPILAVPIWLSLVLGLGLGLGSMLASLSVRFRDWGYVTPLIIQFGLYGSPVAYSVSAVPEKYQSLYYLNPMAAILEAFRWSLNGTPFPTWGHLAYATVLSIVVFFAGMVVMERMEGRFADVI